VIIGDYVYIFICIYICIHIVFLYTTVIGYLLLHTCYVRHIASVMSGSLQRLQLLRLGAVWSERSRRIARNPWSLGRKIGTGRIGTYWNTYIQYILISTYMYICMYICIDMDIPCTLGYKYIYILGSTLVFFC